MELQRFDQGMLNVGTRDRSDSRGQRMRGARIQRQVCSELFVLHLPSLTEVVEDLLRSMEQDALRDKADVLAFPLYSSLPINKSSETYQQNVSDWTEVLKAYQEGLEWAASQGATHYEERHKERGLLLGTGTLSTILSNSA